MSAAGYANALEHFHAGRFAQAQALLRRALARDPREPDLNNLMGLVCVRLGAMAQGEHHLRRALAARPDDAQLLTNLGNLLASDRRETEAIQTYRRALAAAPEHGPAWAGLAGAASQAMELTLAMEAGAQAMALMPGTLGPRTNYANALWHAGRIAEANALLRGPLEAALAATGGGTADGGGGGGGGARHDEVRALAQPLLTNLHYQAELSPRAVFEEHVRLGAALARGVTPLPARAGDDLPETPRRLGVLSSDLRAHSVAYFLEPILRHRREHGFSGVAFHAYMTGEADAHSAHLRRLFDHWHDVGGLDDAALARRIRADRIDVLADLNGHSAGTRVTVMAHRPAPLQATYLGYPDTTGLPGVDVRIVDAFTDPPGQTLATEELLRLERCFLCFQPPEAVAPGGPAGEDDGPGPLPALGGAAGDGQPAGFTFGVFNAMSKINAYSLGWFARVLEAAPGSRLLVKNRAAADAGIQTAVRRVLDEAVAGAGSRVEFVRPQAGRGEHLATYRRVDLALDAFPYHGTTTTCEALWMGVPTVSLVGGAHVSRVGLTLVRAAGLSEDDFIAVDEAGVVALAQGWTRRLEELAALRATMRARLARSALLDGPGLTRALAAALGRAWTARRGSDA